MRIIKFFPLEFNTLKTSTITMPIKGMGDSTGKKVELMRSTTLIDTLFPSVFYERLQKSYKTVEGSGQVYPEY